MAKRIHHMGMVVGQTEHAEFHKNVPDLDPKEHQALMKRMGITKEQDEEWHRSHLTLAEQRVRGLVRVEPQTIGAGFVKWCIQQGWLVERGKELYVCKEGMRELATRFEIEVDRTQRR